MRSNYRPNNTYSNVVVTATAATNKDTKTNAVLVKNNNNNNKPSMFVHCPTPKPTAYFITFPASSVVVVASKLPSSSSPPSLSSPSATVSEFEHSQNQLNLFRLGGINSLDKTPIRRSLKRGSTASNTMLPFEARIAPPPPRPVHETKGSVGSRVRRNTSLSSPFSPSTKKSAFSSPYTTTISAVFEQIANTQLKVEFRFRKAVEHSVLESPKLKHSKLFVFCFISSRYMRYPRGNDDERVVFELIPNNNEGVYTANITLHTLRIIPMNTFLHLELQVQTIDDNHTHLTLVPIGRAVVDYRSLLPDADKLLYNFKPSNTKSIEIHDVYNFTRIVGYFSVSFDTRGGGGGEIPQFSDAQTIIRRSPQERHSVYSEYMAFVYNESWNRFRSHVTYPDGTKVPNPYMNEFAETIEGILPVSLYAYQASIGNVDVKTQNDFVDTLIRMACVIRKLPVSEVRNWNTAETKDLWNIWRLLPVVITCFPRALSYTYDVLKRGSPYNFPLHSEGLEHAQMVCVEHSTLCATIVQTLRTATSELAQKFHPLLNVYYRGCFMHCTVRTGDLDGSHSVVCKHMVYALMPRKVMDSLAVNRDGTPISLNKSSPQMSASFLNGIGFPPLFLETMENIAYTVTSSSGDVNMPGCLTPHEPEFLGGMLPAYYSSDIAFYGDHPYYGDVMTIYPVDDSSPMGDIICLKRDPTTHQTPKKNFTEVMTIGIPLRELLQMTPLNLNTNSILGNYALYMPKPLTPESIEVQIAMESSEETRFLRTVWCNVQKINLTDELVQSLIRKIPERDNLMGWRVSYALFREDEVHERFKSRLQADVKDANDRLRTNNSHQLRFSHVMAIELSSEIYVEGSIYLRAILTTYAPNNNIKAYVPPLQQQQPQKEQLSFYRDEDDDEEAAI
jgi:hypothetical protein